MFRCFLNSEIGKGWVATQHLNYVNKVVKTSGNCLYTFFSEVDMFSCEKEAFPIVGQFLKHFSQI